MGCQYMIGNSVIAIFSFQMDERSFLRGKALFDMIGEIEWTK